MRLLPGLLVTALAAAQSPIQVPPAIAKVAAEADAAREANRLDEAVRLYQQAVTQSPRWAEGWWYLGTIHYEQDRYPQCRDAFRRFVAIDAKMPPAFAMLGLCEFQTREFALSLAHLEQAFTRGLPNQEKLTAVTIHHIAILQTRASNFERALQLCRMLIRMPNADSANVTAVAGIAALRKPIFPQDLPLEDRALAFKLGSAMVAPGVKPIHEVLQLFEEVIAEFPKAPNVHYSYATLLLANDPDRGLDELKKELEIDPTHVPALVSAAFEYLKRGEPQPARPYAEKAVKVAPGNFAARASLGRTLLELDDVNGGIRELEMAAKLAPDSPQVHLSLASAYAKAGRKQDAAREREIFSRLKQMTREATREIRE